MSATKVSICSNALLMLGDKPINSFDDNSNRALLAANLYPSMRDMALRAHPWNCATKRVILAPASTPPEFGYSHRFLAPADLLRVLDIDGVTDYQLEGRYILADTKIIRLRYIWRNEDEATWDALLVEAMTMVMRAAFSYSTTASVSLEQMVRQLLKDMLREARAVDAQENPPETLGDEGLYRAGF